MAKKQSAKATHGRRKVSPKMENPKCKNRSQSAVSAYLALCDKLGTSTKVDELDIEFIEAHFDDDAVFHVADKNAPKRESRRFWARPYRRQPHLTLRTCEIHGVQHYTGCQICVQERFEGEKTHESHLWKVAQVQLRHANDVAELVKEHKWQSV